MKKIFSKPIIAGILLAFVGGSIDAYTYTCRGEVFASMQTGNLLKLGIGIINGGQTAWYMYIIPIVFFAAGVVISEILMNVSSREQIALRKKYFVVAEIFVIALAAFLPTGKFNVAVNSVISFFCAMQYNFFKKLDSLPVATTMCTGNLRSLCEYVSKYFIYKDKKYMKNAIKYLFLILFFVIGATVMTLFISMWGKTAFVTCAVALLVFLIYYIFSGVEEEL